MYCTECNGTGIFVICPDDICRGQDYCMHGPEGERVCADCPEDPEDERVDAEDPEDERSEADTESEDIPW